MFSIHACHCLFPLFYVTAYRENDHFNPFSPTFMTALNNSIIQSRARYARHLKTGIFLIFQRINFDHNEEISRESNFSRWPGFGDQHFIRRIILLEKAEIVVCPPFPSCGFSLTKYLCWNEVNGHQNSRHQHSSPGSGKRRFPMPGLSASTGTVPPFSFPVSGRFFADPLSLMTPWINRARSSTVLLSLATCF